MFAPVSEVYANEFSLIGGNLTDNHFLSQFAVQHANGMCTLTLPTTPSLNENTLTVFTSGSGSNDGCAIVPAPALESLPSGAKVLQALGYTNAAASVYEDSLLVFSGTAELHGLVYRLVALHTALATGACEAAGAGGVEAWPATVYDLLAAQGQEVYVVPQANTLGQQLTDAAARAMARSCRQNAGTVAHGNVQLPNFTKGLAAAKIYVVGHAAIGDADVNATNVIDALTWLAGYMPDFPQAARDAVAIVASKCTFPSLQANVRGKLGAYKEEVEAFMDEVDALAQLKFFSASRNDKVGVLRARHRATGKLFCVTVAQANLNDSINAVLGVMVDGVALAVDDGRHFARAMADPLTLMNSFLGALHHPYVAAYDAGCFRHIYKRSATGTVHTSSIASSAGLSLLIRTHSTAKVTGGRGALTSANLVKMVLCSACSLRCIADAASILCGVSGTTCVGWDAYNQAVEQLEDDAEYFELDYRGVTADVSAWVHDMFELAPYIPTGFPKTATFPGVIGGGDLESALRPLPHREWVDTCLPIAALLKLLPEDRLHLTPFLTSSKGATRSQHALATRKWAEAHHIAGLEAHSWLFEGTVAVTTLTRPLSSSRLITYEHKTALLYEADLFDGPVLYQSCGWASVSSAASSTLSWLAADTFTLQLDGTYRFTRAHGGATQRSDMRRLLPERRAGGSAVYYAFVTATFHTYSTNNNTKTLNLGTIITNLYTNDSNGVKLQGFMHAKEPTTPAQTPSA